MENIEKLCDNAINRASGRQETKRDSDDEDMGQIDIETGEITGGESRAASVEMCAHGNRRGGT